MIRAVETAAKEDFCQVWKTQGLEGVRLEPHACAHQNAVERPKRTAWKFASPFM